jgi:predicted nucleic acid-binding protein
MNFVLDASVALLWLAPQTNALGMAYAQTTLLSLSQSKAIVPAIWSLEIANVVTKIESKGMVVEADSHLFISTLEQLNIETDSMTAQMALSQTLQLARRYQLSAYDAAYLELSLRMGIPLASLDAGLVKAAIKAGVGIWGRN